MCVEKRKCSILTQLLVLEHCLVLGTTSMANNWKSTWVILVMLFTKRDANYLRISFLDSVLRILPADHRQCDLNHVRRFVILSTWFSEFFNLLHNALQWRNIFCDLIHNFCNDKHRILWEFQTFSFISVRSNLNRNWLKIQLQYFYPWLQVNVWLSVPREYCTELSFCCTCSVSVLRKRQGTCSRRTLHTPRALDGVWNSSNSFVRNVIYSYWKYNWLNYLLK